MKIHLDGFFSVFISELETIIIWSITFATQAFLRQLQCEQCDHEETQKHLLNTHNRVGTKFKCNQCDQIACQWCSLKSHKQRKCIKYQCDHCLVIIDHQKKLQNKTNPAQLKNHDREI